MTSQVKTVAIFLMLSACGLSYYMPHMNGHYPFPHWSPFYSSWPMTFANQPHDPFVPSRRLDPELMDSVKKLLDAKRAEVIDRLADEFGSDQIDNETVSSRSRRPFFMNRRPGMFGNFKLPQQPIRNNVINTVRLSSLVSPVTPQQDDLGRFLYFGAGNVGSGNSANYLFKTSYVFSSAVATLCVVSTCIPANQFSSGGSTITCRRKRSPEKTHDDEIIEPSNIDERFDLEPTALPESSSIKAFTLHPEAAQFQTPQNSEAVLSPSFTISRDEDGLDPIPSEE